MRRDLLRNPRRTLASLLGVGLGIGLFSGVLFFVDASKSTMTRRAVAPLALDMQRVLSSPLGVGLELEEQVSGPARLTSGAQVRVTLSLVNRGAQAANEVVVNDEPPAPLVYLPGTTTLDGRIIPDVVGQSPLAQGLARTGLNIGSIPAGQTVTLTYGARATRAVPDVRALPLGGRVSSREDLLPRRANTQRRLGLTELTARLAEVPGVMAADALGFVDLPPGSLHAGGHTAVGPVRVFAFDQRYQRHYPSIRLTAGSFAYGSALLSAEAARALGADVGTTIDLDLGGGGPPLTAPVGGVADLGRARPLFYSRKSGKFEDFVYVPASVVVSPTTFEDVVIPAFRARNAQRGGVIRNEPVLEVDVLVDRSRLRTDPARALAQTRSIAASVAAVAPGQDHLIDNISNTLEVARDDAAVGKRMFLFLGLPAILLAAMVAAYAGSIHAAAQRRELATLRMHGAHRRLLVRVLSGKALALALAGTMLGTALGLVSVLAVAGGSLLSETAPGDLVDSALVACGLGMLTTFLALYLPGRRELTGDVPNEHTGVATTPHPAWRRLHLDVGLVTVGLVAEGIALLVGAFEAPVTSVSAGQAVSFPSALLLAPMLAWLGGTLLCARLFGALALRLPVSEAHYGPVVAGTLVRGFRRRPGDFAKGLGGVGLAVAFGVSLMMFAATYESGKAADARFALGSDLRIMPSAASARPHPPTYGTELVVDGVRAVTPLVSGLDNSVLIGRYDQDSRDLVAIDPASFVAVAELPKSLPSGRSVRKAIGGLGFDGLLVDSETADDLSVGMGDHVQVLLARGTEHQALVTLHVSGLFERFPGFPQGVHLVMNLERYRQATGLPDAGFFLAATERRDHAALTRAVEVLRSGPGSSDAIAIESTETALDKDRSSLTALNVNGLVALGRIYTVLMGSATIVIFVFGLMLQRRREYVILRSHGLEAGQLRLLVLAEAALVAAAGLVAGTAVGCGTGSLLVRILRPLFILDPAPNVPIPRLAGLAAVAALATLASALSATALLGRLRPSELLREA